ALADDVFAGLRQLAVAAGLGCEVDDDRTRAHAADRGGRNQARRGPARDEGRRDHDVEVGDPGLQRLLLLSLLFRRQLGRVAAGPPAVSSPRTPKSRKAAPRLSTCSFTTGRTSNAETTAPSRRAVAIACRPATPAPSTSAFAGATVPAAVISIGKNFGRRSAAS